MSGLVGGGGGGTEPFDDIMGGGGGGGGAAPFLGGADTDPLEGIIGKGGGGGGGVAIFDANMGGNAAISGRNLAGDDCGRGGVSANYIRGKLWLGNFIPSAVCHLPLQLFASGISLLIKL